MKTRIAATLAVAAAFSGCNCGNTSLHEPTEVASYQVSVVSITDQNGNPPISGDGLTQATCYPFPIQELQVHLRALALDTNGVPVTDLQRPVAIRVTPGNLDPTTRWLPTSNGVIDGTIGVTHVFGPTEFWVLDEPPDPLWTNDAGDEGTVPPGVVASGEPNWDYPDGGGPWTYAAGTTAPVYFDKPHLTDVQRMSFCDPNQNFAGASATCKGQPNSPATIQSGPQAGNPTPNACLDEQFQTGYACYDGECEWPCDNRLSPLENDYVVLDRADQDLIVTGVVSDGFYLADLNATPYTAQDDPSLVSWQQLPGLFNGIFVYTYDTPPNIYNGDHLVSINGSVEEFSGDTQLDFPSWVKIQGEPRPDEIPPPVTISLWTCQDDYGAPSKTHVERLCGYYNSDMRLESLESMPVVVYNVVPATTFQNCDANGDGVLPLIANSTTTFGAQGGWGCYPDDVEYPECNCEVACVTGVNMPNLTDGGTFNFSNGICTDLTSYNQYLQWEVEMPDEAGQTPFGTRIAVDISYAAPNFNALDLTLPAHAGVTFDIAGELQQVQAARPRWLIQSVNSTDVCCHPAYDSSGNITGTCPSGVNVCGNPTGG